MIKSSKMVLKSCIEMINFNASRLGPDRYEIPILWSKNIPIFDISADII